MYKELDLNIPGYIIDDTILLELDTLSRSFFDKKSTKITCSAKINKDDQFVFTNLEEVISRYSNKPQKKESLLIYYSSDIFEEISFNYSSNGSISTFMKGQSEEAEIIFNRTKNIIKKCDPSYSSLLKLLVSPRFKSKLIYSFILFLLLSSFYLLFQYYYLIRAEKIGVNIDKSILVHENTIYKDIENAIKSDSIKIKLNTLLRARLIGFINAKDFIKDRKDNIRTALTIMLVLFVIYFLYYLVAKSYPTNLFVFGDRKLWYSRFLKRREIIWITIIIGFIINVIAGLFLIVITV